MSEKEAKPASPDGEEGSPRSESVRNEALDGLIEAGAPWWRRYSPHGEFPWSATGSLVVHFLVVVLIIIFAIRFWPSGPPKPEETSVGIARVDEKAADGDGDTGKTGDLEEGKAKEPAEKQKPEEPKPQETLPEKTHEKPTAVTPDDFAPGIFVPVPPADIPSIAGPKWRPKPGTKGKGETAPGTGESSGDGTSNRERAARWVLISQGTDIRSYLVQLDGLGAAFAVPGRGDRYVYFHNVATSNRTSEERDIGRENRIFWTFEKPSMVRDFCQYVGIPNTDTLLMFLPVELEERMAKMERNYQNKREDQIKQTRFQIVKGDGRYDVVVTAQTLK